jgi:outer membrane protein OmpA-like peptidoglycan-associated protein
MLRRSNHLIIVPLLSLLFVFAPGLDTSAAPQETEISGVTADLAFLRQGNGVLRLGIKLKNPGDKPAEGGKYEFSKLELVDSKAGKKYSILKDANGCFLAGPMSGWHYCAQEGGGAWWTKLPPRSEVILWAYFSPVPPGTEITVQSPMMFPFERIKVADQTSAVPTVGSAVPPITATFLSADRSSGQLRVRLKLVNPERRKGGEGVEALQYESAYALDTSSKRKYPVLKDQSGKYLASPMSDDQDGGRFWYSYVEPGGQTLMSLAFQPPPDSVKTVDIVIPGLGPFENIAIAGEAGAKAAGIAVAGQTQTLDGALKELDARVTPQEIKVQLQSDLLFDFDKADIKKEAEPVLGNVATVLKSYPDSQVSIEGHTDSMGNDSYNKTLSEKRASNVAAYLISRNAAKASQVKVTGWGKSKPVVHNTKPDGSDDPEGRAKNRRVEIIIKK